MQALSFLAGYHSCLSTFISSQSSTVVLTGNKCYSFRRGYFHTKRATTVRSFRIVAEYNYNIFQDDQDRSRRKVQPGERAYNVKKPLGLVLEEAEDGMVFVADIDPRGNAARVSRGDIRKGDILVAISATFGEEVWSTRGVGLPRVLKGIQVRFGDEVTLVFESPMEVESRKQYSEEFAAKRRQEARDKFGEKLVVDPVTWRTVASTELVSNDKGGSEAVKENKEDSVPKYVKLYQDNKERPPQWIPETTQEDMTSLEASPNRSGQYILFWTLAGIGLIGLTAFFTLR
ncbi:hypothetical protein GpartN1_g7609.t1 [Galdieria partita]|uniref:PDZ domain-containing protein n=1 Tax=Galdieria partita TaxID=83374 RepID=A0A9C7UUG5_9RHOD|nr:hypothetical protein GpartN1_g7609.t1 [Galdieria partita]